LKVLLFVWLTFLGFNRERGVLGGGRGEEGRGRFDPFPFINSLLSFSIFERIRVVGKPSKYYFSYSACAALAFIYSFSSFSEIELLLFLISILELWKKAISWSKSVSLLDLRNLLWESKPFSWVGWSTKLYAFSSFLRLLYWYSG